MHLSSYLKHRDADKLQLEIFTKNSIIVRIMGVAIPKLDKMSRNEIQTQIDRKKAC